MPLAEYQLDGRAADMYVFHREVTQFDGGIGRKGGKGWGRGGREWEGIRIGKGWEGEGYRAARSISRVRRPVWNDSHAAASTASRRVASRRRVAAI